MNREMKWFSFIGKISLILLFLLCAVVINAQSIDQWYTSAQERIDTLRKGSFGLQVNDKDGLPFTGDISVQLTKHEYPFGIAFDLYEGAINNGNIYTSANSVSAAEDVEIYQSERWYSFIAYAIPVEKDRNFKLTLKFAEIYFENPNSRIFDVYVDGTKYLSDFDILASAGGKDIAIDTTIEHTASDSMINIELISSIDNAAIKGLVIQTAEEDWITRINCGSDTLTTLDGNFYESDADFFDQNAARIPTEEQWTKAAMQKYFNYGVSGNSFKWSGIQPQHTAPNYTAFDNAVNWTQSIGWELRAHTLLWGGYDYEDDHPMPRWVKDLPTPQAITDTCKMRVVREVSRYQGIIKEYDVMNEPLHATYLSDVVGDSINWNCFKWARSADPDAELFVNEYNVEYNWGDAVEYRDLILQMKAEGAPVTGVGMQAHFWDGMRPNITEVVTQVNIVAEAGLPIKFTEFDNGILSEEDQAEDVIKIAKIAFSHPSMNGLIFWGLSDRGAWRDESGLFYANHKPKLAADTLYYLMNELWSTSFDTAVVADETILFDAYYGEYTIEVSFDDAVKVFTIPCEQINEDSVFVLNESDAFIKGPGLSAASLLSDSSMILEFDKSIEPGSITRGNFKLFSDNPARIQEIICDPEDDQALILTLQHLIVPGDYLAVSYFPGSLSSTDEGKALAFGPETVENLTTGIISASVINDGYTIEAVFNSGVRKLSENASSFLIKENGAELAFVAINYHESDSGKVIFDLSTPLTSESQPTISYTKGTLEAINGFACQSSSDIAVDNVWPSMSSASVGEEGKHVAAIFGTKLLNALDNLTAFTISVDSDNVELAGINEIGTEETTVSLELAETINAGQLVTLSYLPGTITADNGNSLAEIDQITVVNNSTMTDLNHLKTRQIFVAPNPAQSNVQIAWDAGFTELSVFNVEGKQMIKEVYSSARQSISLSLDLESGVYLIFLRNRNEVSTHKLIIE